MDLKNYLLELDSPRYLRRGSDHIRIYGIGNFIKGIYVDLKGFRKTRELDKEVMAHQDISDWCLEKRGIGILRLYDFLLSWKDVCGKNEKDFREKWDEVFLISHIFGSMNGKTVRLPKKMDWKLAYLLGIILGDGHLADPEKSYDKLTSYNSEVKITDQNKETFLVLTKIFQDLFDYTPKIYSELSKVKKPFYRFVIKIKPIHRFLMSICEMPVGNKKGKVRTPEIIKNAPLNIQKWFVAGFFDSDGCITLSKDRWPYISITQYDSQILIEIQEICKKLGIVWNGPYVYKYKYNNCNIKIRSREGVQNFLNIIPILNPIKQKRSEYVCQKIGIKVNPRPMLP